MKKILFTDLDGTLLKNDKTVSSENRLAIQKMLDMGHHLVIATGRSVKSGLAVAKQLGLTRPGCYMIAFNGAVIYDCAADIILDKRTLPIEHVEYLFEEAKKCGLHIQTYSNAHVLAQEPDKELDFYARTTGMPFKIIKNIFSGLEEEPCKVLLISLEESEKLKKFQRVHREWEAETCSSFFSCKEYLEYCPKDVDKGRGVRFLMDFLNVGVQNVFAAGDERNDISMLQEAGTGIAVRNAYDEVKRVADYVTVNDNDHDAVAEIIEKFIL